MLLSQFYHLYKDETSCIQHLKRTREEQGICCKRCESENHIWLKSKQQWQCKSCRFRTTLRSGTLFESSNLPLTIWYQAIFLVCNLKKGLSACELQRQLGLRRYEPAWYMLHKIRKTMSRITEKEHINGEIGLDDAFFLTVDNQSLLPPQKKAPNAERTRKFNVFMMVETDIDPAKKYVAKTGRIRILATEMLADNFIWQPADIYSKYQPGLRNQKILNPHAYDQQVVTTKRSIYVPAWVRTAIGNIQRLIRGIYHHISVKYTQLYMDEFAFKYNYRNVKDKFNVLMNSALTRLVV